ncbi:RNA polymerase factor sigma-54 [Lysobacter sp. GX 14042]|uniref:RNA polymerase factor sigma-54 n=1 Tax=Lysobacter sp. GX 14042 TaxID=2907155 RepID=UPI001F361EFA|nr:RNA polymerase factor sigma-54 [Lysobacter sp. GX 14042]MCE7031860.1 RNA polymerase factor sigma-54 [Lysobacter sp. GX 14042]
MKPRLQVTLGQQLVMTPQLQQAIRLLQMSAIELEAELAEAVESNPLLDWVEAGGQEGASGGDAAPDAGAGEQAGHDDGPSPDEWDHGEAWQQRTGPADPDDEYAPAEQVAGSESLQDHLLWQLHLGPMSPRDRQIAVALIEAIDDDGYLREAPETVVAGLDGPAPSDAEIQAVLAQVQRFDPVGVGARDLSECLCLQLDVLGPDTPGRDIALRLAGSALERLPRMEPAALAAELGCGPGDVTTAIALLRSLDPRPGAALGGVSGDTYVSPDVVIWRQGGVWRVGLSDSMRPRVHIHRGYEGMIRHASTADASYLKGHLQEARWLLRSLEARGETLLKVTRCLVREQAGFLEFGDGALRPLTLREVAAEIGLHESTVSRAIARKYARTPRGTIPLRAFFASGVGAGTGGETSSTAIQSMIRKLVDAEDPRKPLSDARLASALKEAGVPVARRTVAKYREAMGIASSQDRVRMA